MPDLAEIKQKACERLSEYLERQVTEDDLVLGYHEIGADSSDVVVLAFELEKWIGHPIEPELFLKYESVAEALELVARNIGDGDNEAA